MQEKTLREHLGEISRKRWQSESEEARKAHGAMMAQARWQKPTQRPNRNGGTVGEKLDGITAPKIADEEIVER